MLPSMDTPIQPAVPAKPPEQVVLELRARVNAGQELSREEVREALAALRQNRMNAAEGGKSKAPKAPARPASELFDLLKKSVVPGSTGG